MASFHGAPDCTLDYRVLSWLTRGHVLAADPSEVAEVDLVPPGKLPTVVCLKAERRPLVVHVGDERTCGLRLPCHPVLSHPR